MLFAPSAAIAGVPSGGTAHPPPAGHGREAGPSPAGQVHDRSGEVVQRKDRDRAGTVHGTAAASSSEPGGWEGHEEGGIKEHLVASCPFIAQILLKMHAV